MRHKVISSWIVVVAGIVLVSALFLRAKVPDGAAEILVGLWGSERLYGPNVRGELTIDARRPEWRARIAGFDVSVEQNKDAISFVLPGGVGEFRGHLSPDATTLAGHWIQAAGTILNNRYATPVELSQANPGIWRGHVTPLDDTLSMYLAVQRADDGTFTAVIRNPDFNFRGTRSYHLGLNGGNVTLVNMKNSSDRMEGSFDAKADRLFLRFPNFSQSLELTRRKGQDAVGYFPRTSPSAKYEYQPPVAENDGWATASLADAGLDSVPISALVEKILKANPLANPVNIHSLLIARHGKLVLEEYFYGYDKVRTHDMRSASKTFAAVLVGMAAEHGARLGPGTPVYPMFPEYKQFANPDPRKNKVRVKDLMSMTSGLACNDYDDDSPGNEDHMQDQEEQSDWYKFTLDLSMVAEPGAERAVYCSAGVNLIGGVVKNATGAWLPDFFYEHFAHPLQFGNYHLNLTPTGDAYLGGGFRLRPRDELKLGQLYLDGGVWNGRQVVSKKWVAESIAQHASFDPILGYDHGYGYGWHMHTLKVGGRDYRLYEAGGNGGQFVIVVPDLDLVVGFNGGSYGQLETWYKWELELVPQYIIAAAVPERGR